MLHQRAHKQALAQAAVALIISLKAVRLLWWRVNPHSTAHFLLHLLTTLTVERIEKRVVVRIPLWIRPRVFAAILGVRSLTHLLLLRRGAALPARQSTAAAGDGTSVVLIWACLPRATTALLLAALFPHRSYYLPEFGKAGPLAEPA